MPEGRKVEIAPETDDIRRGDQPDPETLPQLDDQTVSTALSPSEDGGVEQHPIHDDDLEDLDAEDFEEMIDEAAEGGFDPTDKYEVDREAGLEPRQPDPLSLKQ